MPEGHTIHRLANDLSRDLRGVVVRATSPQGRFTDSDFAKLVGNLQSGKEDSAADRLSHGMNLPGAFKNSHDTFNEAVRAGIAGDPLLANFLDAPPPKK